MSTPLAFVLRRVFSSVCVSCFNLAVDLSVHKYLQARNCIHFVDLDILALVQFYLERVCVLQDVELCELCGVSLLSAEARVVGESTGDSDTRLPGAPLQECVAASSTPVCFLAHCGRKDQAERRWPLSMALCFSSRLTKC